jgi:hypothetical protein
MRRHYANYFKGLPDFKPFRTRLVTVETYEEVLTILEEAQGFYANSLMVA